MIGVVVDRNDCVVVCVVTGYIPKFKPIKFPNVCDKIFNCGVVANNGKFHVDPTFEYPRTND